MLIVPSAIGRSVSTKDMHPTICVLCPSRMRPPQIGASALIQLCGRCIYATRATLICIKRGLRPFWRFGRPCRAQDGLRIWLGYGRCAPWWIGPIANWRHPPFTTCTNGAGQNGGTDREAYPCRMGPLGFHSHGACFCDLHPTLSA